MFRTTRLAVLFVLLFAGKVVFAQNITGTWQGIMNDEILQVNILQQKDQLCGYTYDILLNDRSSYCKAYFKGRYDKESGIWTINGVSFLQNSGNHVLMTLRFWQKDKSDKNTLQGMVSTRSSFADYFGFSEGERFVIRKVAARPKKLAGNLPLCYEDPKKNPPKPKVTPTSPVEPEPKKVTPPPVTPKPPVKKPPVKKPPVKKPPVPEPTIDSLKKLPTVPVTITPDKRDESVLQQMRARKNTEMSRIEVSVPGISLKVYDNGIVDGDTVSIFYNKRLLVGKKRLSETPLELNFTLDENASTHTLTMFAENLGSIPPNTAVIVVTAGDKRYELRSSASLEENAVLIIDYQRKE